MKRYQFVTLVLLIAGIAAVLLFTDVLKKDKEAPKLTQTEQLQGYVKLETPCYYADLGITTTVLYVEENGKIIYRDTVSGAPEQFISLRDTAAKLAIEWYDDLVYNRELAAKK